jgi:hypothetical protein
MKKESAAAVKQIRQETQFTCVAASIASALKAHGKDQTEADVNKVLGALPMRGASWEETLATIQYFGLRSSLVVPATIHMLRRWTEEGNPVLISWNPEGRPWSHMSVVFKVDAEDNVYVMDSNIPDPDETVRVVPKGEFYKRWSEAYGDSLIIRRPACVVTREITTEGRQVMASSIAKAPWVRGRNTSWHVGEPGVIVMNISSELIEHSEKAPIPSWKEYTKDEELNSLDWDQIQQLEREYDEVLARGYLLIRTSVPGFELSVVDMKRKSYYQNSYLTEREALQAGDKAYYLIKEGKEPGLTRQARFPKGEKMTVEEVADVVGDEWREMNENPPESVVQVREEMIKQGSGVIRQRLTWDTRIAAGGLYGYTKGVQGACDMAVKKLAKTALQIANEIYTKDPDVVRFLQAHQKRAKSKSAALILQAMNEIGPQALLKKESANTEYGMYGFDASTSDLGLSACTRLKSAAGRIAGGMHNKQADKYSSITGYFKEHSRTAKCGYSAMILSCYPDMPA